MADNDHVDVHLLFTVRRQWTCQMLAVQCLVRTPWLRCCVGDFVFWKCWKYCSSCSRDCQLVGNAMEEAADGRRTQS